MINAIFSAVMAALSTSVITLSDKSDKFNLPSPETHGGLPFMETLSARKTTREFESVKFNIQTIYNILYSAFGINRADGKRTVPTALNKQDLTVYALFNDAAYRYDAKENALLKVSNGDFRKYASKHPGMGESGFMVLVIVADMSKWNDEEKKYPAIHAGSAIQNVYLYCSSAGLGTVVCGSYDEKPLVKALKLGEKDQIMLTQIIGGLKK